AATNFRLAWADGHAATLIRAWQDWAPSGPGELYFCLLLSASGEVGQAPSVELVGSMFDGGGEAHKALDELLASCGADPIADFRERMSFRETTRFWAGLDANLEPDEAQQEPQHGQWSSVRPWGSGRVFPTSPTQRSKTPATPTTRRTTSGCCASR